MSKFSLSKIIRSFRGTLVKYSPEILTGLGIAGMVTTVIMAVKATPRALEKIENKKDEVNDDNLRPLELIQATWKCYIPAAVTGALSIGCFIGAQSVNVRRQAALATAYTLSESALREYQAKVVETIGEKKEQAVRDSIDKDKVDKNPISDREILITEKGNTLCYDSLSGRYFKSDIDKIRRAENEMNRRMISDMYISLNDFYDEIGLKGTKTGSELGWNIDKGFVELRFSSQLAEDGTPCLVLNYTLSPRSDYMR
jgi:hypothetical protein